MRLKFSISSFLILAFSIGYFLLQSPLQIALAETVTAASTQEIVERIMQDKVVYLGENHDSSAIHQKQLEIITQLQQNKTKPEAIAFEMFQRPFQPMLDRYLAGSITEKQLREQTEYDNRWGFDWEFYAPILRLAKDEQIPLIALNTPEEITQKVAQLGLDSLKKNDYRYIPTKAEIKLDNREYRQRVRDIYQQHVELGQGNSTDADNFFAAQVLWDETMADAIAKYYQEHPNTQVIVLVGKAHVMYDYAIPDRVARRISNSASNANFVQTAILMKG